MNYYEMIRKNNEKLPIFFHNLPKLQIRVEIQDFLENFSQRQYVLERNNFIKKHPNIIKLYKEVPWGYTTEETQECISTTFENDPQYNNTLLRDMLINRGIFLQNTIDHLYNNSYAEIIYPKKDDIVIYYDSSLNKAMHFGKIIRHNQIRHKFGEFDIFDATINAVPTAYGDRYFFIRKINQSFPSHTLCTRSLPI